MVTCDTLDANFFQNLVLQYILVKVAKFGRYYLKISMKFSKVEIGSGTFRSSPTPQGQIGLNMSLINKVDMVCLSPVGYGV